MHIPCHVVAPRQVTRELAALLDPKDVGEVRGMPQVQMTTAYPSPPPATLPPNDAASVRAARVQCRRVGELVITLCHAGTMLA